MGFGQDAWRGRSRALEASAASEGAKGERERERERRAYQPGEHAVCAERGAVRVVVIGAHRQQRDVEADDDDGGEEVAGGLPEQHVRRKFPQHRVAHRDYEHAQAADEGPFG